MNSILPLDYQLRLNNMYIVWINYGYEGWSPTEFQTLKGAVDYASKNNYGSEFKITKQVEYDIGEVVEK